MTHLETYLEVLKLLPNELQRELVLMGELDRKAAAVRMEMDAVAEHILEAAAKDPAAAAAAASAAAAAPAAAAATGKKGSPPPAAVPPDAPTEALLSHLRDLQQALLDLHNEKLALAKQSRDMIVSYSSRLDDDISNYFADLDKPVQDILLENPFEDPMPVLKKRMGGGGGGGGGSSAPASSGRSMSGSKDHTGSSSRAAAPKKKHRRGHTSSEEEEEEEEEDEDDYSDEEAEAEAEEADEAEAMEEEGEEYDDGRGGAQKKTGGGGAAAAAAAAAAGSPTGGAGAAAAGGGDDGKLYCICQQPSYGDMVGCDNEECPYEWFHFACVGMKKQPKGAWYCDECRSKME